MWGCFIAARSRLAPASSTPQNSRTSAGPMSALDISPVPPKRCRWRSRAASTRTWMVPVLEEQVRRLAHPLIRQLFVLDAGYVHVDVDAIQQRAGDALLVAADHRIGAGALFDRVAVPTAGTGVHGPD